MYDYGELNVPKEMGDHPKKELLPKIIALSALYIVEIGFPPTWHFDQDDESGGWSAYAQIGLTEIDMRVG